MLEIYVEQRHKVNESARTALYGQFPTISGNARSTRDDSELGIQLGINQIAVCICMVL